MTTLEIGWKKIPENGWELNPRSQFLSFEELLVNH
jgi:hypothetical protein